MRADVERQQACVERQLVCVLWEDAQSTSRWERDSETKKRPLPKIYTGGWLIHRDKKSTVIALNVDARLNSDRITIPRSRELDFQVIRTVKIEVQEDED